MTDLHTHILPGMDDGPKTLPDAMALLERAALQGVDCIALTSHFSCENESVEAFLARREMAFSALREACPKELTLKRGCEVYFSPRLLTENVEDLCLEGTKVLLLELPVLQKPAFLREVLTALVQKGITPLIAHVERYQYVAQDPCILADWVELGALIQVNAQSVLDGGLARKLIKWGLCHVVASDAHSVRHRPVNLRPALETVAKTLGSEKARELEANAADLFSGRTVNPGPYRVPKKVMGFWL